MVEPKLLPQSETELSEKNEKNEFDRGSYDDCSFEHIVVLSSIKFWYARYTF